MPDVQVQPVAAPAPAPWVVALSGIARIIIGILGMTIMIISRRPSFAPYAETMMEIGAGMGGTGLLAALAWKTHGDRVKLAAVDQAGVAAIANAAPADVPVPAPVHNLTEDELAELARYRAQRDAAKTEEGSHV